MNVSFFAIGYFLKFFASLLLEVFDVIAYSLVSFSYSIFYAISKVDIFGTPGGKDLFNHITERIYQTISIVMIFVFAYYLIMLIIDPDGKSGKSATQLVKQTIISILLIIILPTIFGYLSVFQQHVLDNHTIEALILDEGGTLGTDPGQQIAMMLFSSNFHPENTQYSDYFDEKGEFIGKDDIQVAIDVCKKGGGDDETAGNPETCEAYAGALNTWYQNYTSGQNGLKRTLMTSIAPLALNDTLQLAINEEGGMYYGWILSVITAVIAAWFFISFAIDLGVRAVKLGVLQLIAPIPVLMNVFPAGKKTFDAWFGQLKKTYLELFVRLAIVFLAVTLIQLVPSFWNIIWDSNDGVPGGIATQCLANILLILGILKFAKDCPQLFKDVFSSNSGMFAGMNFKPGIKKNLESNEYGMKAGAIGVGAIGGGIAATYQSFKNRYSVLKENNDNASDNHSHIGLRSAGYALKDLPRGIIAGGKGGYKNRTGKVSLQDTANAATRGSASGVAAYNANENLGANFGERVSNRIRNRGENITENVSEFRDAIIGAQVNANIASDSLKEMNDYLKKYTELAKKTMDSLDNELKTLKDELLRNGTAKYADENGNLQTYTSKEQLETLFKEKKRKAITKAVNGEYKEAANTYMATMLKDLSKNMANISSDNAKLLNKKVESLGLTTVDQLIKKLSDKNHTATVQEIGVLQDVSKEMGRQQQNIIITSQIKQQEKESKKESK